MEQDIKETKLEPYPVKYHLDNPPPEDRCGALSFNCRNPDCDFRFPDGDRETKVCPVCGTLRGLCGNHPRRGINESGRCAYHGGAVPKGIQNVHFKGRSISSHLPTRLLQIANLVSREDAKDILNFYDDIELFEIRMRDLTSRLGSADSKELWHKMSKAMREYRKLEREFQSGKVLSGKKMLQKLEDIENLIAQGSRDYLIWEEIIKVSDAQRKLREAQIKKNASEEEVITKDMARGLIVNFLSIIKERVLDQDVRSAIINDMNALLMVK